MGQKRDFKDKEVFTTYDAARICNANIASIKNWIAKGLLRAFRTPGGHYRIKRRDLELFVQKYNMPYPFAEKAQKRVYALDAERKAEKILKSAATGHEFRWFAEPLGAALHIGLERPDAIFLDYNSKAFDGPGFLAMLLAHPETRNIQVVLFTTGLAGQEAMELRKKHNIEDIVDKKKGKAGAIEALSRLI